MTGSAIVSRFEVAGWQVPVACGAVAALGLAIAVLPLTWAGVLVAGGVAVVATLIDPRLGLLLIAPAVPFGSLAEVQIGEAGVGATEAVVALVIGAWLVRRLSRRTQRLWLPGLTWPLAAVLLVAMASTLNAASAQHAAKEIVKWSEVLAVYLLVANEVNERWMRVLAASFLATGAAAALLGIYQFLFRVGPEGFLLFGRFMRAYGTFEQPNPYGGYLGITLPLAVGMVLAGVLHKGMRVSRGWLVLGASCGALMLLALVMSWSRGAWLGAAAGMLAILAAAVARGKLAALAALVLVAALIILGVGLGRMPDAVRQRLAEFVPYMGVRDVRGIEITDANYAVLERMAHWQAALGMWSDHPWLGVGIGNYEVAYASYAMPLWPLALGHAHNFYLNMAAEAGVLGLMAFLTATAAMWLASWRSLRMTSGWSWALALGIFGAVAHLTLHNLVDNLFVHGMYLQVAVLLGMVSRLSRGEGPADGQV